MYNLISVHLNLGISRDSNDCCPMDVCWHLFQLQSSTQRQVSVVVIALLFDAKTTERIFSKFGMLEAYTLDYV